MANIEQVKLLRQGVAAWNAWRRARNEAPDLIGAELEEVNLSGANLSGAHLEHSNLTTANLMNADLSGANLFQAKLIETNLTNANLEQAWLSGADLAAACLDHANCSGATFDAADLSWTSLVQTDLSETGLELTRFRASYFSKTKFSKAYLDGTLFADVDLSQTIGLSTCEHFGPSTIDHITLQQSGELPLKFLRGAGLQEALIMALPEIRKSPNYYSCFISYSHKDERFARRLKKDLSQININSWFAPHDMKIGEKVLDEIDSAISRSGLHPVSKTPS